MARSIRIPLILALLLGAWPGLSAPAQSVGRILIQADSLLTLGKTAKALAEFDRAVAMESTPATHLARARALFGLEKSEACLKDLEMVLKLDSSVAEAYYMRGSLSMKALDPNAAEADASRAIALARTDVLRARSHLLRGEARSMEKRNAGAIEDLEKGLATVGQDIPRMVELSRLYDEEGRYSDALRVLESLCDLESDNIGHWVNRGFELIRLERYEEAMSMVQRALLMDKDEPVALSHRAYINLKMGRDQEAWTDVERSLKSYPTNAYALRTRALLRLRRGDRERACDDLSFAKVLADLPEVDLLMQEHCSDRPPPKRK